MTSPDQPSSPEKNERYVFPHSERNRTILRWTLSAISVIHALLWGLVSWGMLALRAVGGGEAASRTMGILHLVHAGLLAAAGWALWRPRRGAWVVTLLAGLGSLVLVVLDLRAGRWQSVPTDGLYPLVAALIWLQVTSGRTLS